MATIFRSVWRAFRTRANLYASASSGGGSANINFDGDNGDLACDEFGALWTKSAPLIGPGAPIASGDALVYNTGAAGGVSGLISTIPCALQYLWAISNIPNTYILLFDTAAALPIAGAVPTYAFPCSPRGIAPQLAVGAPYALGNLPQLAWAVSTRPDVYALLGAGPRAMVTAIYTA